MNDQHGRAGRLRYSATGALAALAAVGAIAGASALAAKPHDNTHGHAAVANGSTTKTPTSTAPDKGRAPQPGSSQPFLTAVQRLVSDGTITTAEGHAVDREILAGSFDQQTLTASGFTQTQLQAVEHTLESTKRAL